MAYVNLTTSGLLVNSTYTFMMFRDFMCSLGAYASTGAGWTYHDSYYSGRSPNYGDTTGYTTIANNDYFVMKSTGEDGNRNLYFKVLFNSSGFISILGYLYWNNSTHAGVQAYGTANNWQNTAATNNTLWVYANLDHFLGIAKYSTTYYSVKGGWMPDSSIDQSITTLTGTITAGSSVTCTFSSVPAAWAVNTYLFVQDTAHIERVRITNIAGNNVTFATFVNSYAANSKFCLEMTYFCSGSSNFSSTQFLIDHNGDYNTTCNYEFANVASTTSGDGLTGLYACQKIYFASAHNVIGPLSDMYVTLSGFTSETPHTVGAIGCKFFNLSNSSYTLVKEV